MNIKPLFSTILRLAAVVLCLPLSAFAQQAQPPASAQSKGEYQKFALMQQGDAGRGKAVFEDEKRTGCARCHTVDGKGGKAGPDLFAVGDKFGRREIIEAVLSPSATIAVGYSATMVETKAGEQFLGVVKRATAAGIELMGADGKLVRIATADIKEQRISEVSLMPENLQAGLSTQEFTDLVDYLVSLKLPASANLTAHGMPATIEELARPITFRPFNDPTNRFEHLVWFGAVPGLANGYFVVEHETGRIWLFEKDAAGERKSVFAELDHFMKGTRGLLGIGLHAKFRENRKYYIAKHVVENRKFATLIYEREATADYRRDSGKAARLIIRLDEDTDVHYGGGLMFGPDGYLYIGMGDSGPQEDPSGNGQNRGRLLGKMLRIDVDHAEGEQAYAIPRDNPFVGEAGVRPEIWAYGFREPWRFSFDPVTGDLWVGDVGQDRYEEVDLVRRGGNYGWNVYEGFERFSNRYRKEGVTYLPPVFAYNRKYGVSATGGFVYRGDRKSSFYGVYIFGDYQTRRVWGLTQEKGVLKKIRQLGVAAELVTSFGCDAKGELHIAGYDGTIFALDLQGTRFE